MKKSQRFELCRRRLPRKVPYKKKGIILAKKEKTKKLLKKPKQMRRLLLHVVGALGFNAHQILQFQINLKSVCN
jgi:hypothetical protein